MPDIVVRGLTVEQRDELKDRARLEHRSMNGLLLQLVESYLGRPAQVDNPYVPNVQPRPEPARGQRRRADQRREQVTPNFKGKPVKR